MSEETKPVVGGHYFSKVKKARQALKDHAEEIYAEVRQTIHLAVAAGQYEVAIKAQLHLLEHMPKDEGEGVLDQHVDKRAVSDDGPRGPIIQIGVSLGGLQQPTKQIEPVTVDVRPETTDKTS